MEPPVEPVAKPSEPIGGIVDNWLASASIARAPAAGAGNLITPGPGRGAVDSRRLALECRRDLARAGYYFVNFVLVADKLRELAREAFRVRSERAQDGRGRPGTRPQP